MRYLLWPTWLAVLSLAVVCGISPVAVAADYPAMQYNADAEWPTLPPGWNFGETVGVAVDGKGHVYVFHRGKNPIMEFSPDGRLVRSWGEGMFIRAHSIRVDPEGNIWTVDNDTHQVLKMDPSGRVRMVLGRYGTSGETDELFNQPTDVGFGPNGEIYVTDGYGNSRVVKFSKQGRYVTAWGKPGTGEGEFDAPHAVVVDQQGRVYVGDRENYRVQIFDADGKFLTQWKHVGSPWGLDLQPDGTLFMSDGHNERILKLNLDGKVLGTFGRKGRMPGELGYPHHIGVDSDGNVFAAEIKNQRVQRFSPN
jgi:DNA-binding beta-propeller fold protein YncE